MNYEEAFDILVGGTHVKFKPEYIEHKGRAFLISNLESSGSALLVYEGSKSTSAPPRSNYVTADVEQLEPL